MSEAKPAADMRIAICCADSERGQRYAKTLQDAGYPYAHYNKTRELLSPALPKGVIDILVCDSIAGADDESLWQKLSQRIQPNLGVVTVTKDDDPRWILDCVRSGALSCHLINEADTALAEVVSECIEHKLKGASQYRNASELRAAHIIKRLRLCLDRGSIDIQFQPIVQSGSWFCNRVEVLARWTDGELGPVSASEFVPLAEEHGLVEDLGRLVFVKSLEAMKQLRLMGHTPKFSLNISRRQFDNPNLVDEYVTATKAAGEDPSQITFEVTETARYDNDALAISLMRDFLTAGFKLAIDDFGTGESSFAQMSHVAYHELKVDRSLIACVFQPAGLSILRSVIGMAKALNMYLVAEGVEDEQTAALLDSLDVDYCQGYYFSKPMELPQLAAYLEQNSANLNPNRKQ